MKSKMESLKYYAVILFTVEIVIALLLEFVFKVRYASFILIFVVVDALYVAWLIYQYTEESTINFHSIKDLVTTNMAEAVTFGDVGIVTYNQEYLITWMSDLFNQRDINYVGEKITMWLPEINQLFQNEVDRVTVEFEGYRYLVIRGEGEQVLYFKDITDISLLRENYKDEKVVVGIIHMDNYNETVQYEDEQKIALINANLRQKVIDWCVHHKMMVRRIRSDRFMVVLNEAQYAEIAEDNFSILNDIRKEAEQMDVSITLSMAFARGTSDYLELDKMVNDMLELAQNRGGDQVAVKVYGENPKLFGGSTEAQEKRSRVRVRVMAKTIQDMIENSSKVFIVGHKEMDFDCFGAAIGISRIASMSNKEVYIALDEHSIERKVEQTIYRINAKLVENHNFIPVDEVLEMIDKNTLVIAVDHHRMSLSSGAKIIEASSKTMVIDHHRRSSDDNIPAVLVYIETSASSTTELITELFEYQHDKIELLEEEANVMFAGMLVDTNHFRTRSGSRTFEAAAQLRKMGADPASADDMLKETYREFELRNEMLSYSSRVFEHVLVCAIDNDEIYNRTALSIAADELLSIKDVKATFVIANIDSETVAISARSAGEINVQTLMEKMGGGGHFTGAALQRKESSVKELEDELMECLKIYMMEEKRTNESNIIE